MAIPRSVADVLRDHVMLEYEAIDRMYLNVYVPSLQTLGGIGIPAGSQGPRLWAVFSEVLLVLSLERQALHQ